MHLLTEEAQEREAFATELNILARHSRVGAFLDAVRAASRNHCIRSIELRALAAALVPLDRDNGDLALQRPTPIRRRDVQPCEEL